MDTLDIFIYIFIILILIICITKIHVKLMIKLNGGEWFKYVNLDDKNDIILPSVSQVVLSKTKNNLTYDILMEETLNLIRDNLYKTYNEKSYYCSAMFPQRAVSDANIDMYYLSYYKLIQHGFGVCEYKLFENEFYGNNLITVINHNNLTIVNKYNGYKDINIDNYKNFNVYVYIEFCYNDESKDIIKSGLYENIHNITGDILETLIDINMNTKNENHYYIRITKITEYKTINKSDFEKSIDSANNVFCFNDSENVNRYIEGEYYRADEFLVFKTIHDTNFYVVIEHNENWTTHKSNIIKFMNSFTGYNNEIKNDIIDNFIITKRNTTPVYKKVWYSQPKNNIPRIKIPQKNNKDLRKAKIIKP